MKKRTETKTKNYRIIVLVFIAIIMIAITLTSTTVKAGNQSKFYLGLRNNPCPYRIITAEDEMLIDGQILSIFNYAVSNKEYGVYLKTKSDFIDIKGDTILYKSKERQDNNIYTTLIIENEVGRFKVSINDSKILLEKF